jgi:SPP1 family phage portal protein
VVIELNTRTFFGRRIITTDATFVDDSNIVAEIEKAMTTHLVNRSEINYLWDYYRGKQPILHREKEVRPEICNMIVENRANEIVSFKVGYLCGEPIQYVGRNGDDVVSKGISQLNEMMFSESKATQDKELVEWQMICGTAYRLVLPDSVGDVDDAPFEMYTLDPQDTFVVYSNEVGRKPLFGVKYITDESGTSTYSVYSDNHFWKIKGGKVLESVEHYLGMIPIFEYPANNARQGAFEIVLPLLDAINKVASNRLDGLEQFVQSFIKFINCDISTEDFQALKDLGAIKVKSVDGANADVDMITNELNQMQTQTLVDYLYQTVLTICGIPNRNGGSSTSDTGSAVLLRDGWSLAESRAKDSELMFKKSEKPVLKLILKICRDIEGTPEEVCALTLKDIEMQFTRRNYENIQSKSQVLVSMLQQNKIHPRLAFENCGLFIDAERAYAMSKEYEEEQAKKAVERAGKGKNADDIANKNNDIEQ